MVNEIERSVQKAFSGKNLAVGNDLVFIPGFTGSLDELFVKKVYTDNEVAYCDQFSDSVLRYASTWAAKEAVYKALKQLDDATIGWNKIEITRKKNAGAPVVTLHNYSGGDFLITLTISHDGDYAWAIAVIYPAK
jgi:phosphopantetheine--protein transferase-like protein